MFCECIVNESVKKALAFKRRLLLRKKKERTRKIKILCVRSFVLILLSF